MSDFSAKVAAGMALLDQERPGWRQEIDLGTLDLGSCSVCVLGQIFGDYEDGLSELGIGDDPYKYGFNALGGMSTLTQAWKDALGQNKVLVEAGDEYTDETGCCGVKVVQTEIVSADDKTYTVYIVKTGYVANGAVNTDDSNDLTLLMKSSFEKGGSYPKKLVKFQPKAGMFITNDTGKVYYVKSTTVVREVTDQSRSIWLADVDKKGLREATTSAGLPLSEVIGK